MKRFILAVCAVVFLIPGTLWAQEGSPDAEEIVRKMVAKNTLGLDRGKTVLSMLIQNARGEQRKRTMAVWSVKGDGDAGKSRIRIEAPPDARGIELLLLEQSEGDDLQYLYLPSYKKVQRIAGSQKNEGFLQSDLTYADMESRDAEQGTKTRLADEVVAKRKVYRVSVASAKNDDSSEYSRVELWIDQTHFLPLKMEFYDKAGKLKKTFFAQKIGKKAGRVLITRMLLKNVQKGTQTKVILEQLDPKGADGKDDSIFRPESLGRPL